MNSPKAFDRVVTALRMAGCDVQVKTGNARTKCPAHKGESNTSLAITARADGKGVVIFCHAQCDYRAVLEAIKLNPRDMFDVPLLQAAFNPEIEYKYPGGRNVHRRSTPTGKDFWQTGNTDDDSLYRSDAITDDAETVYVVEGEKDVLAAEGIGLRAVCSAQGAGKANLFDWSPLAHKHVVVVADDDEPGRKHALQVVAELEKLDSPPASVKVVQAAEGCKDFADHVANDYGVDDLVDVAVGSTERRPRQSRIQWASEITPERQIWLWDGRIPSGTVSMVSGRGSTGKTTYVLHLAAQLSRGRLPGEHFGIPRATLIWSGEDAWDTVLVPRLMAAGADLTKIGRLAIDSVERDGEVTPRFPLDAEELQRAIVETGAAFVIIDPIASAMDGNLHSEGDVRNALDELAKVCQLTRAVVAYVRHFNKGSGIASDKASGSHAFRDAARSVFLFACDEENECVVVTQDKGNYSEAGGDSFKFKLENTVVATASGEVGMGRVVDLGLSAESVEDIINRVPGGEDSELEGAGDWLEDYLDDQGPWVPSQDVKKAGGKAGFSESTLKRAKIKRGVRDHRVGFPRKTVWGLRGTPKPSKADEPVGSGSTPPPKAEPTEPTGPTGVELLKSADDSGPLPTVSSVGSAFGVADTAGLTDGFNPNSWPACAMCGSDLFAPGSQEAGVCERCRLAAAGSRREADVGEEETA